MMYSKASAWRYLIDEVPAITNCYSHQKCKFGISYGWGKVGAERLFDADNFAILPSVESNQPLELINQVNGLPDFTNAIGFNSSIDDWAVSAIRSGQMPIINSAQAWTYIAILSFPQSTRTALKELLRIGDIFGVAGGVSLFLRNATGDLDIRFRQNATIQKVWPALFTGDDIHMLAITYNGSLNRSGIKCYFDNMNTPVTPTTDTGGPVTSGPFLVALPYWCALRTTGISDGQEFEFIMSQSEFSPTQLNTVKEILMQNPNYSGIPA